jgi:hypothetical protein
MAPMTRAQQIEETIACGKDPTYFMKKYVRIQHPERGVIPFETYQFQDDCLAAFRENRFNIVLKSRQLGLSTITAGYALWLALFYKDKSILVIATKLPTAVNFIKKVKTMLNSIPPWLHLCTTNAKTQEIEFGNGSIIKAIPTSDDAGRSESLSLLIVDEAAFVHNFEEIWTGIYPTISTGGRAIILSTPNGVGGQYYKLWTEAEAGANLFNTIKLPWHVHPEHDQAWFNSESKNLPRRKVAQEFLCDFISSGETFLQQEQMDQVRDLIADPTKSDIDRNLWVWEEPIAGKKYVVSADVSRGDAGGSGDFSACHVIDIEEGNAVAEYMGKIPPDKFAELLFKIGMKYNTALLVPENNGYGWTTATRLRDMGYPLLYNDKMRGDPFDPRNAIFADGAKPGFSTQTQSRHNMLVKLEELIRNKRLNVFSQRLFDQLQGFVWQGHKAMALRDCHDDLVISLAIGAWFIEGESVPNQRAQDMTVALMKSTKVLKRDVNQAFSAVAAVRPVGKNPQLFSAHPMQPRDASLVRGGNTIDFSWLYR